MQGGTTTAERMLGALGLVLGVAEVPLRLRAWDGSEAGPDGAPRVVVRSRRALRRLVWAPGELGLARAYVSGDLDVEGDVFAAFAAVSSVGRLAPGGVPQPSTASERLQLVRTALRLGAVGLPPAPPPEEVRPASARRRHSRAGDAAAIGHHYDVGNDFYRLVLGPSMVYSCAVWEDAASELDAAQEAKLELVCRKLGLRAGQRVLDIGCGWGSFALHAAQHHGVEVVGVTLSREQAALARERVAAAGLADRVTIRVQDYRDVDDGPFDAVSSIGMAEHVGRAQLPGYARRLHDLVVPGGRVLNHAIAWNDPSSSEPVDGFIARYVFPDGELVGLDGMVGVLEGARLEVLDVEALRPHYPLTLRAWVANLEKRWPEAVALTSEGRARVWRLYMAASALAFEAGAMGVNQVLARRPDGTAPPLRLRDWR